MNIEGKEKSISLIYKDENNKFTTVKHDIGYLETCDLTHTLPCANFKIDHKEDCLITFFLKGWKIEKDGEYVSVNEINDVEPFDVEFASTGVVPLMVKDGFIYKRLISNEYNCIGKGNLTYIPKNKVLKVEIKISNKHSNPPSLYS